MNASDYILLEDQYGAHNYLPLDVVLEKGEGIWVYDIDGNKYMDCLSAYSAVNLGHCHPRIIKAMIEQAQQLTLTSRAFRNNKLGQFYKILSEITGYEMILPMNTGAEAVETALKAAITPDTVAFMVEPIQGEGGVIVPLAGYLQAVRRICDRYNVLFMADEIQTGLGRTGKLFACDHDEVRPDVMIIGKALAGGVFARPCNKRVFSVKKLTKT